MALGTVLIALWLYDLSLPPLWLEIFLPDKQTASQICAFNRAYQLHLLALDEVWQREAIRDAIRLNQRHYAWWDAVRDEHNLNDMQATIPQRRQVLKRIIEMIGFENYLNGKWPGPIP